VWQVRIRGAENPTRGVDERYWKYQEFSLIFCFDFDLPVEAIIDRSSTVNFWFFGCTLDW
jgi:hypothetical protein